MSSVMVRAAQWPMTGRRRVEAAIAASLPIGAPKAAGVFLRQSPESRKRSHRLSVSSRMAQRFAASVGKGRA